MQLKAKREIEKRVVRINLHDYIRRQRRSDRCQTGEMKHDIYIHKSKRCREREREARRRKTRHSSFRAPQFPSEKGENRI